MVWISWHLFLCICQFCSFFQCSSSKEAIIKNGTMKLWFKNSYTLDGIGAQWTTPKVTGEDSTSTCGSGKKESIFWFITQHISVNHSLAHIFYVDVEAHFKSLCEGRKPCFSNAFELYVYRGEEEPAIPSTVSAGGKNNAKMYIEKHFSFIGNVTNSTAFKQPSGVVKRTFILHPNKTDGITFAGKSRGACGTIHRMKMYYYYCEESFVESIKFEKTISPANGSKQVLGTCSNNSKRSPKDASLIGYCHRNGTWRINDQSKCLCLGGYEPSSTNGCLRCSSDSYKSATKNLECSECPSNSISTSDPTSCRCKEGYYKPSDDQTSSVSPCYGLVKITETPTIKTLDDARSINITWSKPTDNGGINETIFYDVQCFVCLKTVCNDSCWKANYSPRQYNLTETYVVVSNLKLGKTYMFKIYPRNSLNQDSNKKKWEFKETKPFPLRSSDKNNKRSKDGFRIYLTIICVVSFVLLIIVFITIFISRRRKDKQNLNGAAYLSPLVGLPSDGRRMYVDPSNYDSPEDAVGEFANELDPSLLHTDILIGGGEFGDVYKGSMTGPDGKNISVAVKVLKKNVTPKSEKDFLLEASVMGQFDHPNVVRLQGVVTKFKPRMIVIEFMSNGSLDNFLTANDGSFSQVELITMAKGVSSGMEYLAGINFIHRDLAARNVLVNETLGCKVSDFGLSRELEATESSPGEYATTGGRIPVRWTAPEAFKYRKFSSASDVWSFGILLWEIMSYAVRPYWEWDNFKVMEQVDEGFRLPAPLNCPKGVHDLMLKCWKNDRSERPSFSDITVVLDGWILSPKTMEGAVDLNTVLNEWLQSLKMGDYLSNFTAAGYRKPSDLFDLKEEDLKEMGVRLVGHRNKILKGIKAMQPKKKKRQDVKREISLEV